MNIMIIILVKREIGKGPSQALLPNSNSLLTNCIMIINNFLKNITKYLNLGKEICIFPVYGCKFCCYSGMPHRHGYYSRVARKVKKDSTISIQNILFEVPLKYVGETINVRYDPTSVDKAYIFSDENILLDTVYPVKKIDNSKIRRKHNFKSVDFSSFNPNDKENERSIS